MSAILARHNAPMQIFGDALRFGVHSGPQNTTYESYRDVWLRAEELGFDWVSDFDHFLPIHSDPAGPQFEGTTLLSAMAAQTSRVRCAVLVLGVTYRHPAVVANIAATIDHVSGGRLELGMGAAWFELEHQQYGIPFPRIGVRMDMLDEACRIMRSLWTQETTTFEGKHYQLKDARLEPKPVQERLPLVIGGSGERRTLRIVAEHGDVWNTFYGDEEHYRHLLDVLAGHCADVGRDPADVRKSLTFRAVLDEDEGAAQERIRELHGGDPPERTRRMTIVGTPEQCVERLMPYARLGVGDFLLGAMPPYDEATVEHVARSVAPALRAEVAA
jgi:F420-dependent oxidoreductase-like protein